ncbi:unnamed protein product [Acanthoscelides obtectus]|uniref:Uncharacterized protein n=1 Tax=Acanthoscelides obtectus TaxID=200917 RepID=A0A9P0K5E5_ACAOB|nr:unnamed protein product [Acanthoscelides obtectus]CAK1634239.1 hypothetical protein AOBTE_LOCUS8691 [Acanthoscelides obtectus]
MYSFLEKLKTDCVVKGSNHHSKMPFWICQQTSGISASKIGRAHADVY